MRARKQRTKKQRIAAAVVRGDDVPLEQRKFGSEVEGRTALHARGFRQMHTPAGTPLLWIKEGDQRAVAQRGRKAPWMIVKYPMEVLRTAQRKIDARLKELAKEAAKAEAARSKRAPRSAAAVALTAESKLRAVPDRTPKMAKRVAIQKACVGDMTVAALCKKAKTTEAELAVMLSKKFFVVAE